MLKCSCSVTMFLFLPQTGGKPWELEFATDCVVSLAGRRLAVCDGRDCDSGDAGWFSSHWPRAGVRDVKTRHLS